MDKTKTKTQVSVEEVEQVEMEIRQDKAGDVISTPRPCKRLRTESDEEDDGLGVIGDIQNSAELQKHTCNLSNRARALSDRLKETTMVIRMEKKTMTKVYAETFDQICQDMVKFVDEFIFGTFEIRGRYLEAKAYKTLPSRLVMRFPPATLEVPVLATKVALIPETVPVAMKAGKAKRKRLRRKARAAEAIVAVMVPPVSKLTAPPAVTQKRRKVHPVVTVVTPKEPEASMTEAGPTLWTTIVKKVRTKKKNEPQGPAKVGSNRTCW